MSDPLPLRIVLVAPPAGVQWALQVGRAAAATLQAPERVATDAIVLATTVTPASPASDGPLDFRGPAVQGPRGGRFLYANSGRRAGDGGTHWDRRAKIPLAGLTPALVTACRVKPGAWLEARVAGTARDGGPACATVPLLDGGWRVVETTSGS